MLSVVFTVVDLLMCLSLMMFEKCKQTLLENSSWSNSCMKESFRDNEKMFQKVHTNLVNIFSGYKSLNNWLMIVCYMRKF